MQFSRAKTKRSLESSAAAASRSVRRCEITYVDKFETIAADNGFISIAILDAIRDRYRIKDVPRAIELREVVRLQSTLPNTLAMSITFVDKFHMIVPDDVDFTSTIRAALCDRWGVTTIEALPGTAIFHEDIDPGILSGEIQLSSSTPADFSEVSVADGTVRDPIQDHRTTITSPGEMLSMLHSMKSIL